MRFSERLNADFPLIPDPTGRIVKLYGVKLPLMTVAKRVTFVIAQDGTIEHIDKGLKAIEANTAIDACPID